MNEDAARMAEMAEDGDDDDYDDGHSPSAGSATSLELYQSVRGIIADGHVRDKDQISMKSDCAMGLRRRPSILYAQAHKVRAFPANYTQLCVFFCSEAQALWFPAHQISWVSE